MIRLKNLLLVTIIFLSFVLRFYNLDSYPALNADEASWGYDAYSLIQTGKDQHGNSWPIDFESFGDYKPGLYGYLVLPFVKVLGLNEWAVRLPNAIISVASIYLIYQLVKEIFGREKEKLALISALFLAISPWHIHFSRGGWEVNVATFLLMVGVWLWIKSFNSAKKNVLYIVISILSLIATLYTYQATRVVAPLIGISLVLIYRKEVISDLKRFIVAAVIGMITLVPLIINLTQGNALSRAAGVGLFADPGPRSRVEEQRGSYTNPNSLVAVAFHNKAVNYALAFAENWASHFEGNFLFISGDEVQRNKVPETGQMYLVDVLFLLTGIGVFFRNKIDKNKQVLLFWIGTAPVASALTFQSPSALRAENLVIPLVIISALGCYSICVFARKTIKKKASFVIFYLFLTVSILWCFARYQQMYWQHMSKQYPYSSQYGVKELVNFIEQKQNDYRKVLVTDRYDQPYILFLFYMKYSPALFQQQHTLTDRDQFGYSTVNHFGKYYFSSIIYDEVRPNYPVSLIAGTDEEIPNATNIIKRIYGTNGFLYFKVIAN